MSQSTQPLPPLWTAVFFIALYIFMLALVMELSRRFRIIQILLYWVMPFIIGPIFFLNIKSDSTSRVFFIYKLISVVIGTWLIQLIRHGSMKWLPILKWLFCAIFIINIFEAIIFGTLITLKSNIFPGNALFGLILLLILPNPSNMNKSSDGYNCVQWKMGALWIIAYTVWNTLFTYTLLCYPIVITAAYHLGVPLLAVLWTDFDQWMQYRAYALCLFCWMVQFEESLHYSLPYFSFARYDRHCAYTLPFMHVINIIAFIIGLLMLIKHIYDEIKTKQHGHVHLYDATLIQFVIRKYRKYRKKKESDQSSTATDHDDNSEENNLL